MESLEDGTSHANLYWLFDGISLRWEDRTILVYSVGASFSYCKGSNNGKLKYCIDGEVKMSVIWVISLDPLKHLQISSLMVHFIIGFFNWFVCEIYK